MPVIDCLPVICGGCGANIWVAKEYSVEPMCWECREKLSTTSEATEASMDSEVPSAPIEVSLCK